MRREGSAVRFALFPVLVCLLHFRRCSRSRPFSDDLQHRLRILRAIVMNLFPKMRDEAPRRHRNRLVRLEFRSRAHPPSPRNHCDEPVVRMPVRMAHVMRSPLHQHDVKTRLRRISRQHRHLRPDRIVLPLESGPAVCTPTPSDRDRCLRRSVSAPTRSTPPSPQTSQRLPLRRPALPHPKNRHNSSMHLEIFAPPNRIISQSYLSPRPTPQPRSPRLWPPPLRACDRCSMAAQQPSAFGGSGRRSS
jgi:hypothetical protein